ncbi:MAG: CDP-alcohol phosphatidyltransferase family protein, partial [Desulfobacteraceae bacterium]|nr:CDP-alcohol phosphatidyltransferase family protein [Desulfobacteraceae bacterium]
MTFYEKYKNIIFTPNFLTLLRILAIPVIIVLLLFDNRLTTFFAAIVFSIASITDYLDGYLARKYNLVSNLGKMLDPLADKLLISSAFIMLVSLDFMPA